MSLSPVARQTEHIKSHKVAWVRDTGGALLSPWYFSALVTYGNFTLV